MNVQLQLTWTWLKSRWNQPRSISEIQVTKHYGVINCKLACSTYKCLQTSAI
ncbi:uncharacterized protein Smp_204140 [Schistosoma mansoni]|uniref:uncharacterized protein n=1 Tax=Schistosoma mansoni TaxID=6183 RepID=UPI00022DCAB1|nr:uncharacterized protein Smp_204140 [Schistosoma mansoni]|eukprot:XP_018654545.1 uncharacterized protein Smp_204140 [Schistosoma mansoni]